MFERELEKMFHDVGGCTSSIAFLDNYSNLIIDDDKLGLHSMKANKQSHKTYTIRGFCLL